MSSSCSDDVVELAQRSHRLPGHGSHRRVRGSPGAGSDKLFKSAVALPGAAVACKRDAIHGIMVTAFGSFVKTSKIIKLFVNTTVR